MRFFFLDRTTRRTRESGCMSFCLLSSDFFFQGFTAALNNSCEPSEPPESENGDAQQKEEGGQSSRGIPGLPIRAEGDQVEAVDEEDGSHGGHQTEPQQDKNKHGIDRKSTRLNSSHLGISYAVFCLKKKKIPPHPAPTSTPTIYQHTPTTLRSTR